MISVSVPGHGTKFFVHGGNHHAAYSAVGRVDLCDGVRQHKRNIIVAQTLHYITVKTGRIGHKFDARVYVAALESHTASHDKTDVAAAQNYHFVTRLQAFHVHQTLSRTGGIDTRAARSGNVDGSSRTFAATACENNRLCLDCNHALFGVDERNHLVLAYVYNRSVYKALYISLFNLIDETLSVFGTGEFFLESVQSETVVNALIEYSAQSRLALQDHHIAHAGVVSSYCGCKSGGTAAYDYEIAISHFFRPPLYGR